MAGLDVPWQQRFIGYRRIPGTPLYRETLSAIRDRDAVRGMADRFDSYLQNPARFAYNPVLRHGDFGGSNILYDPQTNRVSGVIDFDSLALGDPATDVAALSTYGEEFFALCLNAYPEMQAMLDRAPFYRSTFALQEAYYGLRGNDQPAFHRGIAEYM